MKRFLVPALLAVCFAVGLAAFVPAVYGCGGSTGGTTGCKTAERPPVEPSLSERFAGWLAAIFG
jgi:hypothetical protein